MAIQQPALTQALGDGRYTLTKVVESKISSYPYTGTTNQQVLASLMIPALGPNDVVKIEIYWSMTNNANVKTLKVQWMTQDLGYSDARATIPMCTQQFTIRNRGVTNKQVVSPAQNYGPGNGTCFTTVDSSKPTQMMLLGTLGTATDTIAVEAFRIEVWTPPAPPARLLPGTQLFYGVNGHYDDGISNTQIIANLKLLKMKSFRATWEGNQASLNWLVALAQAFVADGTGLILYVCLDISVEQSSNNLWGSETAAYNFAYTSGRSVATALAPYGVRLYECGNELDGKYGSNWSARVNQASQGTYPSDFTLSVWPLIRGAVNGCMDGVRSVQANAICASNAFIAGSIGASDMLWNGTNPDGSGGGQPCRWDITAWHNYKVYGDLMNMYPDYGLSVTMNLLSYLKTAYGKPIIISEWNNNNSGESDAQYSAWASQFLYETYNNRYELGIASVMVYEMLSSPLGVITTSNQIVQTFGQTVVNFITNNPDTGN